ncbi:mas-related G-protein coupled receptor member A2B-like [Phascolarctos cinereus]
MAASHSPELWEYSHDSATERSANGSLVPGAETPGKLFSGDWIRILILLVALVGLVGNSFVMWLLGFRIQRNPFSVYILNLAGADSLFLCCTFLVCMYELFRYSLLSFMYNIMRYLMHVFYTVGLSLLAAISSERCLAVLFPHWYQFRRPKHTSAAVCSVLWALNGLFEVADHVSCFFEHLCLPYVIIEFVWFILLTCVLCVSSLTLLLRVQCSSQHKQPPRLYLLVLLTVLVFLLCGLPLQVQDYIHPLDVVFEPYWICQLLACVNSSINPVIYFFLGSQRHKRRREPLRVVLQRALGDGQELGNETRDTSHTNSQETSF